MEHPYFITYYCGFPKTNDDERRYREAIDCGFNLLQIEHGSTEEKQEALRFCEKMGVRACIHDQRITDLVYSEWEKRLDDPEALEKTVREVCEDFRDYPALLNYFIIDEPSTDKYPLLGAIVALFRKYDPAHYCYINLNPGQKRQEEYMDVVKPAMLSFDRYHLMRKETSEKNGPITDPETAKAHAAAQTKYDNPGWYNNLEEVRQLALRYDVPYMIIILLTEHGQYRYLTREEISYEACQALAYGSAVLSYFRYWNGSIPPNDTFWRDQNSCIQGEGDDLVRCQHYYDVQAVNAAIRPIGERIAQTKSEAVFHVGEEQDSVRPFAGYGAVRAIRGGRYTVGFFEDDTFLVANKDYLAPSECELEADGALERFDAAAGGFVPAEKKILLPAGGCAYLRLA
jgi:hypothetical protein